MTEQEILYGLMKTKEKNPDATIGIAVEQLFGLDPFTIVQNTLGDSYYVYVNYSSEEYNIQELLKVICEIHSMTTLDKIILIGEDENYGISLRESLLLKEPGHCMPLPPATISHDQVWHLLSSRYKVNL